MVLWKPRTADKALLRRLAGPGVGERRGLKGEGCGDGGTGEGDGTGLLGSGGSRVETGGSQPGVILVDLLEGGPGGGFVFCLGAMVEAADQISLKPWTEVDAEFTKSPGAAEQERKCSKWLISTWKKAANYWKRSFYYQQRPPP